MKNKGLVITALILLAVVIILLIMFLGASISGKRNFNKGILDFGKHSETVIFDKTYDLENIQNIDIKQDAGDIIFKEGADNKIQVVLYGNNKENAKVNDNEGRLEIDYRMEKRITFFSFGLSFGDTKNDIIIYLPTNYDGNIKIDSDYGNVEMIDLENAKLNIKCDAGNIEIGKIKNITANCDYGNIEIAAGIGQMSDTKESETITLNKIIAEAKKQGNQKDVDLLESSRKDVENGKTFVDRVLVEKYGYGHGYGRGNLNEWLALKSELFGPEWNRFDLIKLMNGTKDQEQLLNEVLQKPITSIVNTTKVPTYFIMGKYDGMTSPEAAKIYFDSLEGEVEKEYILYDNSAHYPHFGEKEKFYEWMVEKFK